MKYYMKSSTSVNPHLLSGLGNARHRNNKGTGGDVRGGLLGGLRLGTGTGSTGTRRGEAAGRGGRGSPTGKGAEGVGGEHGDTLVEMGGLLGIGGEFGGSRQRTATRVFALALALAQIFQPLILIPSPILP